MGTFLLGFLWPILLICLGLNLYLVHLRILLCCCSAVKLCPTLCNPVDCSTPGFPIFHQLSELAQTHVHRVGDDIQPSLCLYSNLFLFKKIINYFWLCWVFVAVHWLSLVAGNRGSSLDAVFRLPIDGASLGEHRLQGVQAQ